MEFAYKVGIVVTVVAMIVCPIVAHRKGRSAVGWFFLGLLLGGLGIIIVCCLSDQNQRDYRNYSATKVDFYTKKLVKKSPTPPSGWKCPSCGTMNSDFDDYCIKCLADRRNN